MSKYNLTWTNMHAGAECSLPVRFFIYDPEANAGEGGIVETGFQGFEQADGEISYERHTIRENGCKQICLTKMPRG